MRRLCLDYVKEISPAVIKSRHLKVIKYIPELMELGENTIRWLLNDRILKSNCNDTFYREMIFQLAFRSGVLAAEKWHTDYDKLSFDYVTEKFKTDFMDYTARLMKNILGLQIDIGRHGPSILLDEMFDIWNEKLDSDLRSYSFSENHMSASLLAVYVIATSMMLEKYGYQLKAYNLPEW